MPGKRVQFDDETWGSLDLLAKDRMATFQELADEAFRDLLRKHGRPATLREALRRSAGHTASVVKLADRRGGQAEPQQVAEEPIPEQPAIKRNRSAGKSPAPKSAAPKSAAPKSTARKATKRKARPAAAKRPRR